MVCKRGEWTKLSVEQTAGARSHRVLQVKLRHLDFIICVWKVLIRGFREVTRSHLEKKDKTLQERLYLYLHMTNRSIHLPPLLFQTYSYFSKSNPSEQMLNKMTMPSGRKEYNSIILVILISSCSSSLGDRFPFGNWHWNVEPAQSAIYHSVFTPE